MEEHADLMNGQPVAGQEVDCVFDEKHEHYLLVKYGWPRRERAYYTKLHVRIKDGKIWVEDWTEERIAIDLIDAGIPREDIILAFNPPEMRHLTEFIVA